MSRETMERKYFTAMAELAGDIQAGRVRPSLIAEEFATRLDEFAGFKREKFLNHARVQVEMQTGGMQARTFGNLEAGETFRFGDNIMTAEEVEHGITDEGEGYTEVYVTTVQGGDGSDVEIWFEVDQGEHIRGSAYDPTA